MCDAFFYLKNLKLRFSHGRGERETRGIGDEPPGTMGRVQTEGSVKSAVSPVVPLTAFLCAPISRERSGYEAESIEFGWWQPETQALFSGIIFASLA